MKRHRASAVPDAATRIPAFKSRQEEAEWWDTHDVTEYMDELVPVPVTLADGLSESVTIRVDAVTMKRIRTLAREQGVDATALLTIWILERLQADG